MRSDAETLFELRTIKRGEVSCAAKILVTDSCASTLR
jgi:hypothetical protein